MSKSKLFKPFIAFLACLVFYTLGIATSSLYLSEKIREHDDGIRAMKEIVDDVNSWRYAARIRVLQLRIDTLQALMVKADEGRSIDSAIIVLTDALELELENLTDGKGSISSVDIRRDSMKLIEEAQQLANEIHFRFGT